MKTKPYGIVSDQHFHNWSAFSSVKECGINSRLNEQLAELRRCADETRKVGGNLIINAGDTFHIRGNLPPSVLNPVLDLHKELIREGFDILVLAGNHDAENKEVTRLSSAVTALESVGCKVFNETTFFSGSETSYTGFWFIPWQQNIEKLKEEIEKISSDGLTNKRTLIIHAPVDDVIVGIPNHGLNSSYLAKFNFNKVFSGHFHHYKDFGNGVYSIGSTTHHTWSDVNTKAGFLVVDGEDVKWFKSHAPEFVEIDSATDPAEIPMIVDGNYVRIKTSATDITEIEGIRELLIDNGAKGVTIISQREASVSPRGTASVASGMSLEASVSDYVSKGGFDDPKALEGLCVSILSKAKETEGV
ncbi:metallophosphoesterase [Ferrovum sp.]|uniref:metallophosphoesterase family protein n=1 Tax=Ferrovum sp. TaxID=2609467 RepID=UPI002621592E|nr:metallophosphoesterase [Ferrovum sp.]